MSVIPDKPYSRPSAAKSPSAKPSPSERRHAHLREGAPTSDGSGETPKAIGQPEVVAIALVGLLLICVIAGLYFAKAFFLPITMAFIVGTMLSPAAGFLERYRIPRAVAAVLIVAAASAGVTFMVGLIASPAVEWSSRLPELGGLLRTSCTCSTGRWRSGSSCRPCSADPACSRHFTCPRLTG